MAFTFVAWGGSYLGDGYTATLTDDGSLNVAAGDLLIAFVYAGGDEVYANTTAAIAKDSGTPTNAFTFDEADHNTEIGAPYGGQTWMGYKIAAEADATATFKLTLGAAKRDLAFLIGQFRPDGGETVTKDTSAYASGSGTSANSDPITTTGTDEVVAGGFVTYNYRTFSSEAIGGTGATGIESVGAAHDITMCYRIATVSNGAATATVSVSETWHSNVISFKSEAAVGGAPGSIVPTITL